MMDELRILALNGFLGYGYSVESLAQGLALEPHFICADAGSSDPGPSYLGSGAQLVSESQVYRDLYHVLPAAAAARIPLIIGSAGTAGARPHLHSFLETLRKAASDLELTFTAAVIPGDIPHHRVEKALVENRIRPMSGVPPLTADAVSRSLRIVGQMGTEPIIRALSSGPDIVVAGRACDTALYAAPALMNGFPAGLAVHMGKILECGALCAVPAGANDCLMGILRHDHFLIRSVNPKRRVTVESVAAHSLYEQEDPTVIVEPEGTADLSEVEYRQIDEYTVRVSGSRFVPAAEGVSIKLEGAAVAGFRTITLAGIRDPLVIANLDGVERTVRENVSEHLDPRTARDGFQLNFRYYGRDAVLGKLDPDRNRPVHEIGLLIEAIAPTEKASKTILSLARSSFLHCHFPGRKTTAGNAAFPFSPSDIAAGPVYEFSIYHLIYGEPEERLFPVAMLKIPRDQLPGQAG